MSRKKPGAGILVTGGTGLLGHALKPILPGARFLSRRDCDLRDGPAVRGLFSRLHPERVMHLAARVGGVKENAAYNADFLSDNVLINANVLSAAAASGVKHMVSILSPCAYQFYPDRPSREEDLHAGLPFAGNLGYGLSKRLLEAQSRLLWEQSGLRFSTITPVTLYGPHDNFDPESGHVVAALILKAARAKREGRPLEIWGSGRAVRQFIFAPDAAAVASEVLQGEGAPENLIVAPDAGISIRELAEAVAEAAGYDGHLHFDPSQPEGAPRRVLESGYFKKKFPGRRFTPLGEGLRETVRWFLAHSPSDLGWKRTARSISRRP